MTQVPGLDQAGLTRWLEREHPELAAGPLTATLMPGGRSNLTYRVDGARIPLVVRRPPLGHVLSSAHDMAREHRVISALRASQVPVPRVVDLVDDTEAGAVTGTVFFVMEHVSGAVLARPELNAGWTPEALRGLSLHLAEVLADLHTLDPAAVGLGGFGRPDGYLARQLRTWRRQYDASRSRELPALDRLQDRLGDLLPEQNPRAAVVHGDYRLDNVIVTAPSAPSVAPRVAAVIDWEMATLGDPLVDLGMLAMYWEIAELTADHGRAVSAVVPGAGYPGLDELVDAYAARARVAAPELSWYRAFATYKLAVILEGIHYRFRAGETVGDGFDTIGDLVLPLAEDGLARIATRRS
ncbi:phosphotransferase family protein [Myceligenerans salitolerans]|uniref:Phosphotransferase family protein n=1 Tax=Myceligenerans salitolerans TaxID=1230528 RepID=A0ABS3I3M8_9MICO|nr:phosphotransferase family protein [Myceligenerans salitolerans]MBO0607593.1 phosphotransferase family protein [Myceligenerans salitolerans]